MDLIDRGALRKELAYMWYDNMNATAEDVEKRIFDAPTVEAVRHGKWLIEAHKEKTNNRWNVTAECSECAYDLGEIWAGFFPGIPDGIAENVCFNSAKSVDVGNYCPNCGAKMGVIDYGY